MSSGTSLSLPDGLFAPYELVRQLGHRANPLYVLRQPGAGSGGKPVLAVAERFVGRAEVGPGGEDLAQDARRIATLASPNLARIREVLVRGPDLVVIGELVEGEKLQELWRPEKLPLEIALRIVVDALAGVGALHNLRDARQEPMKLAHGELSPATIVIGLDGIARVLHAVSRRAPDVEPEVASRGYLAPEVASGDPYDARADVFSAGVLLWEALSGKTLFVERDPPANARRVRSGPLPAATVPEKAAWAKGLVEVAAKALDASPDARWPTAAVMAAELRKAAGLKLAPASTAAAFARSAFGDRVKTRRESFETAAPASPTPEPATPAPASPRREPEPARRTPDPPRREPEPARREPDPPRREAVPPRREPDPPRRELEPPRREPDPPRRAPEPPRRAPERPSPPESSFLDVELHSAVETVLVAPGLRAPVEEVVELGSDFLIEAARQSSIPPAASSALGGFVLDPFAAEGAVGQPPPPPEGLRFTPPPVPVVGVAPVVVIQGPPAAEEASPPSITGAPHFAAAIDTLAKPSPPAAPAFPHAAPAFSPAPPAFAPAPQGFAPSPPAAALQGLEAPASEPAPRPPGAGRRKVMVLGGVAALGLVIFVLAAVRLVRREPEVTPAKLSPPALTASAVAPPPPTLSAAVPSPSPPPTTPPPPPATAAAVPPAQTTAPHPQNAAPAAAPPAVRPTPAAALPTPSPVPAAHAPSPIKPRPKPTFDPNTL
ncbi:MAG TPA: protein kinase [Polyangiaceae bacterium]